MGTSPVDANTGGVCVFEDAALKRAVFQRDEVGAPLQWRALYGGSYGALFSAVHSDNAGLPWRPVHGRAAYNAAGALTLYWVRRAAEIGDNLDAPDILTSTRYRLLAFSGDQVVRDIETTASEWTYADADSDQADRVEVAEIGSDGRLGPPALISLAP